MKVPFAALLIVFSCLTSAHASQSGQVSIGKNTLSQLLLQTVRSECQLPQQLHPYAEGLLGLFNCL